MRTPLNTTPTKRSRDDSRTSWTTWAPIHRSLPPTSKPSSRDGLDPDVELEKIESRNDFDINRLNAMWDTGNAALNPRITMDELEKSLRDPALLPEGWTAKNIGGKHWKVTDPQDRTIRVTTDAESYEAADGRLRWWEGPWAV